MLLSELLRDIVAVDKNFLDINIQAIVDDSRDVVSNSIFVCVKGKNYDGHDFAKTALNSGDTGTVVVIAQKNSCLVKCENIILVEDTRKVFALICKRFYGDACDEMQLIACTGTNGKTSVSTIINSILKEAKIKSGMITTIKAEFRDLTLTLDNTTPKPNILYKIFSQMYQNGCETICMEASSQALDQKRLEGCIFDVAIFTNLTQDHLDYHKTIENYFIAKKQLFKNARFAVINIDDDYGKRIIEDISVPYFSYSLKDRTADFFADEINITQDGVSFLMKFADINARMKFPIAGIYSVLNVLATTATAIHMGISIGTIKKALEEFSGISGRCEKIETNLPFDVFCDYAHTPDGLLNILKSVRQFTKGRLILLFGAGGDRDEQKRALMGKVASENADFLVVTSDNPRTESQAKIMGQIIKGIDYDTDFIAIESRTDAIKYAMSIAKKGDTVLLAGKGHELYNVYGDKKIYYDERKIVLSYSKRV